MFSDMVLCNGKVITMDARESIGEAVAIKFGRILASGSNKEIKPFIGPDTEVIDLKGRCVIPGMIETHLHLSVEGKDWGMGIIDGGYDSGVKSITDILNKVAEVAKKVPKDEWIDISKIDLYRLPSDSLPPIKEELDKVSPDNPVMISTSARHLFAANSKAFEKAGVTKDTKDPPGGRFERDPSTGEFTGWLHEKQTRDILQPPESKEPTLNEAMEGIKYIASQYITSGLTCAYDGTIWGGTLIRAYQELLTSGELPIRVRLEIQHKEIPLLIAMGIIQGFGNEMLKIGGIKTVIDGGIYDRTAAVAEPYLDTHNYLGELNYTKDNLRQIIMEGYSKGLRFCSHANGERAINMFLDIIEEAQEKYPRKDPRNRIIHCTIVTPEIISRIKKLGVLPTIISPYLYCRGDKLFECYGAERLERMFAARSFLDAGVKVASHSDHGAAPFSPLLGIHILVNRKTIGGKPTGVSQKISVMEALKLYTINAAYHTFEENSLGSIEPGKLADIVVLGEDILTIPTSNIKDVPVDITILGGKIIYQRKI